MLINCNTTHIPLKDKSVHCIPTSPPYFGLRLYDLPPQIWGGQPGCGHVWGEERKVVMQLQRDHNSSGGFGDTRGLEPYRKGASRDASTGQFCQLCSAWRGSLGNEPTMELYIAHMVEIGREVWRVLRDDGVFWLNLGDSYACSPKGSIVNKNSTLTGSKSYEAIGTPPGMMDKTKTSSLKAKQLMGIPWTVAFALRDDGWYLRQEVIWSKAHSGDTREGAAMPYSGRDRFQTSHEHIFILTKKPHYFFDYEAVKDLSGARRSVWRVVPENYKGAHFATWPTKLVAPMIKAATSQAGVCGECGAQWERVIEKKSTKTDVTPTTTKGELRASGNGMYPPNSNETGGVAGNSQTKTLGWHTTCHCYRTRNKQKRARQDITGSWLRRIGRGNAPTVPATVLDPFCGSGTTGLVCRELGREFIGLDLSMKYLLENALPRVEGLTSKAALAELPMFAEL